MYIMITKFSHFHLTPLAIFSTVINMSVHIMKTEVFIFNILRMPFWENCMIFGILSVSQWPPPLAESVRSLGFSLKRKIIATSLIVHLWVTSQRQTTLVSKQVSK